MKILEMMKMKKLLMALVLLPLMALALDDNGTYCIVDLSGGPDAESYPVSYINRVPEGGWTDEYKTSKLVLRRILPGTFEMGSPKGELRDLGLVDPKDELQHTVRLTQVFYVGVFEITQRQFELIMGTRPAYHQGYEYNYRDGNGIWHAGEREAYAMLPIENVSYVLIRGDTKGRAWPRDGEVDDWSVMGRLRRKTGLAFDLPTEAQWEYSCRAGTTTAINNGEKLVKPYEDDGLKDVANYCYAFGTTTYIRNPYTQCPVRVGLLKPNAWGLYDMLGNVSEWCLDAYDVSYGMSATEMRDGIAVDPVGASASSGLISRRVYRGGSYASGGDVALCRSAGNRTCEDMPRTTPEQAEDRGFRVCFVSDWLHIDIDYNDDGHLVGGLYLTGTYVRRGESLASLGVEYECWLKNLERDDGALFKGWYTEPVGGKRIAPTTLLYESMTIYAQWGDVPAYANITLNPCCDADQMFFCVEVGHPVGELPIPIRAKHRFLGWYTAKEGGVKISAATKVTADVTYYAHWQYDGQSRVDVKVTDGCMNMGAVSGGKTAKGGAKVTLKATAKKGFVFVGWYQDAEGWDPVEGGADYRSPSYAYVVGEDDVTFYAKFIPVAEDWVSMWCRPQDEYVRGGEIAPLAVEVNSASLATVKVTGLPTGLKFTAKPLTLKETNNREAMELPANTIYGTPTKSGIYTATITATTAGKKSETYKVDFVVRGDGEYLVDVMGLDGADYPDNGSDAQHAIQWGKMSGYGVFKPNTTATLKATANRGYVFAGWFSDVACVCAGGEEDDGCIYTPAEGTVDYRSTSFPVKVGYEDVLYCARFVRTADDGAIGLAVNGNEVVDDSGAVRVVVKDAATLPLVVIGSVSIPKASVKGLPAGLKWDTKKNCLTGAPTKPGVYKVTLSLTNTTVKKAIVRAFTIEVPNFESPAFPGLKPETDAYPVSVGVAALPAVDAGLASAYAGYTVKVTGLPSGLTWKNGVLTGLAKKAGDYTVTFTATQGKDKQVSTITVHVEALPDWTVGTFVGMVRQVDHDESGEIVEDEDGLHDWYDILTTVSVTSAGKVSGKLHFESGTDVSFKSDSISERTDAGYVVRGQLKARGIATDFELLLRKIGIETTGVGDLGAVDVLMRQTSRQEGSNWIECDETTFSTEEDAPLRQNVWSSKKLPLPPSVNGVKKTVTVEDNIYTLTFGKNGSVKVSLAKADKPTKAIASGSATLSIVGHASEVWHCELCTSVVVKKNDYGAVCIFDVTILEDGTVTCVPQK